MGVLLVWSLILIIPDIRLGRSFIIHLKVLISSWQINDPQQILIPVFFINLTLLLLISLLHYVPVKLLFISRKKFDFFWNEYLKGWLWFTMISIELSVILRFLKRFSLLFWLFFLVLPFKEFLIIIIVSHCIHIDFFLFIFLSWLMLFTSVLYPLFIL